MAGQEESGAQYPAPSGEGRGAGEDVAHWATVAEEWIRWVRHPNHDAFWAYQTAFERLVGPGEGAAIEIGAGEGRISRVIQDLGYHMTVCEPVEAFLTAAREAESGAAYILAPGHALPLEDAKYDLAVLYNMLMDVADVEGTLSEALRVLRPGGRLIVGIVHPFADLLLAIRRTGLWEGHGSYFETRILDDKVTSADGLTMHFRGWSRPLGDYLNAIAAQGGALQQIVEPRPDPDYPWRNHERWGKLPLFLWIDARKPSAEG